MKLIALKKIVTTMTLVFVASSAIALGQTQDEWLEITTKKDLYLSLGFPMRDEFGWPRMEQSSCDALKFASLYAVSGATWVNPLLAEDTNEPGLFFRRPRKDCLKDITDNDGKIIDRQDNGSKSSISRDMFLGLLHWIFATENFAAIDRIIHYGLDHTNNHGGWVMGHAATIDRNGNRIPETTQREWLEATIVNGPLQATFCQLWKHLREKKSDQTQSDPNWLIPCLEKYNESYVVEGFFVNGYITHLHALHILLRMKMLGETSWQQISLLRHYSLIHSRNALFQAMIALAFKGPIVDANGTAMPVGDQERQYFQNQARKEAYATLLNKLDRTPLAGTILFPENRLPQENDRSSFYLFQRDLLQNGIVNDDWLRANPPKQDPLVFEAIDYLFATHVLFL
jgi:hypothetical protein